MAEAPEETTPLRQKLDSFGTFLSKVCMRAYPSTSDFVVMWTTADKIGETTHVLHTRTSPVAVWMSWLIPLAKVGAGQVIAVICALVWIINIPHFNDPAYGSWVSTFDLPE